MVVGSAIMYFLLAALRDSRREKMCRYFLCRSRYDRKCEEEGRGDLSR